jgi:hypothetical protein
MHYPADRTIELPQLLNDVALAISAMDHDWKVERVGERQVSIEPRLLFPERGAVPVAVEAGLADRDDTWTSDHIQNEWPVVLADFRRLVGVNADSREDSPVLGGKLERPSARGCRRADRDDLGHAFHGGALEDARKVSAQASIVEVGVCIDQWAGGGTGSCGIHEWAAPGAARAALREGFRSRWARPQSLQGNWLSILGLLDSLVNVVLNSGLGPGLENSFVGLGPLGARLAPCAQLVVYLSSGVVPRRCC